MEKPLSKYSQLGLQARLDEGVSEAQLRLQRGRPVEFVVLAHSLVVIVAFHLRHRQNLVLSPSSATLGGFLPSEDCQRADVKDV